jgi:cytoskeletal protein RodZ
MAEIEQDQALGEGTIGERLRVAREEKGLSLEDIARQSRIPIRHLEHIERGEWDALPAITYSVGFVRSYANAVGLDGAALGQELRQHLGAARTSAGTAAAAYYEPADPARVPPRSIAIIAIVIGALLLAGYLIWRSSAVDDQSPAEVAIQDVEAPATPSTQPGTAQAPGPAVQAPVNGLVALTAIEDVWMKIDQANGPSLFNGTLKAGQRYEIPSGAQAPKLRTGRANVLRVTVGNVAVPPLGPPERTISDVSLAPADLVARAQGSPAPAPATPANPTPGATR